MTEGQTATPGFYPDPYGGNGTRFWDGQTWTSQVAPLGATMPPSNEMGVASLVLGIVAILIGWLPYLFFLGWIPALLAIVFGALALVRVRRRPEAGRKKMAIIGLVLGILTLMIGAVWVIGLYSNS